MQVLQVYEAKCEAKGVELDTGKNVGLQCWILYDTTHIMMLDCIVDVFVFVWAKEKKKMAANRAISLEETKNETIDFISAFFYFLLLFSFILL